MRSSISITLIVSLAACHLDKDRSTDHGVVDENDTTIVNDVVLVDDGGALRWDQGSSPLYAESCQGYFGPPAGYEGGTLSGQYWITPGGSAPQRAYCDMAGDGGWTLVMRLGTDDGLANAAPQWTSGATLDDASPSPDGATSAVYSSYATVLGNTLRGCIAGACITQGLAGQTALSAMQAGVASAGFTRAEAAALVPTADLSGSPGCGGVAAASGLDVAFTGYGKARFGMVADDHPACTSPDVAIGFGLASRDGATCSAGAIIGGGTAVVQPLTLNYSYIAYDPITVTEGGFFSSYLKTSLAVDWDRDRVFFISSDSNRTLGGLHRMAASTMIENQQRQALTMNTDTNGFMDGFVTDAHGYWYGCTGSTSNTKPISKVDPVTMIETAHFGTHTSGLSNTVSRFVANGWMAPTLVGDDVYLVTGSVFNDVGVLAGGAGSGLDYVWGSGQRIPDSRIKGIVAGRPGEVWIMGGTNVSNTPAINFYKVSIAPGAHYDPLTNTSQGVSIALAGSLGASEVEAGAPTFDSGQVSTLVWDAWDDSLIFSGVVDKAGGGTTRYLVKWKPGAGVSWATATLAQVIYHGPFNASRVNGSLGMLTGLKLYSVDTTTGSVVSTSSGVLSDDGAQVWDSASKSLVARSSGQGWVRIFFDTENTPPPVNALTEQCSTGTLWVR